MSGPDLTPDELGVLDTLLRQDALDAQTSAIPAPVFHAAIDRLMGMGCAIESAGPGVYRLAHSGLGVWSDYIADRFARLGRPRTIEVFQRTASTQDLAKARAGVPMIVLADEQSAGRGRLGRSWVAPPGVSVLMSMTWPHNSQRLSIDKASLLTSVAIAEAVEPLLGRAVGIKWPNDIVIDGRKLAGILIETVDTGTVIGIGLNVGINAEHLKTMPDELRDKVTSFALLGRPIDRLRIAADVAEQVERHLADDRLETMLDGWRRRSTLGDHRAFLSRGEPIQGTVLDIDADAGLIVRRDSGEIVTLAAATTTVVV